jgi:hypothetical protein
VRFNVPCAARQSGEVELRSARECSHQPHLLAQSACGLGKAAGIFGRGVSVLEPGRGVLRGLPADGQGSAPIVRVVGHREAVEAACSFGLETVHLVLEFFVRCVAVPLGVRGVLRRVALVLIHHGSDRVALHVLCTSESGALCGARLPLVDQQLLRGLLVRVVGALLTLVVLLRQVLVDVLRVERVGVRLRVGDLVLLLTGLDGFGCTRSEGDRQRNRGGLANGQGAP